MQPQKPRFPLPSSAFERQLHEEFLADLVLADLRLAAQRGISAFDVVKSVTAHLRHVVEEFARGARAG